MAKRGVDTPEWEARSETLIRWVQAAQQDVRAILPAVYVEIHHAARSASTADCELYQVILTHKSLSGLHVIGYGSDPDKALAMAKPKLVQRLEELRKALGESP